MQKKRQSNNGGEETGSQIIPRAAIIMSKQVVLRSPILIRADSNKND